MEHNPLESTRRETAQSLPHSYVIQRTLARDARLEVYLTQVTNRLPRRMSPSERQEQRQELALHLDALVSAHMELDRDEETAVLSALREFGDAKQLGRELARVLNYGTRRNSLWWLGACHLLLCGLVLFTFRDFPSTTVTGVPGHGMDLIIPGLAGFIWGHLRPLGRRWYGMVLAPVLLGCALLPLSSGVPDIVELAATARVLLFLKWAVVASCSAGLTVTLGLLFGPRERQSGMPN